MGKHILSLEPVRETVRALVFLIDRTFATSDIKVGVYEGGFTNDSPWRVLVTFEGAARQEFKKDPSTEMLLKPQTLTDWILDGGGATTDDYARAVFVALMERIVPLAYHKGPLIEAVRVVLREGKGQPWFEDAVRPIAQSGSENDQQRLLVPPS
jgi:hypothetical protein